MKVFTYAHAQLRGDNNEEKQGKRTTSAIPAAAEDMSRLQSPTTALHGARRLTKSMFR
jgi:hypothetical protein